MNQEINNNVQNNNKLNPNTIGLAISIINVVYCIFMISVMIIKLFSSAFDSSSSSVSGWFVIILPVAIVIYILSCVPDYLCTLFSVLYKNKEKKVFLILTIILSLVGYLIMNSLFVGEFFSESDHMFISIYKVLKIIIIIYSIILLIFNKKRYYK